MPGLCGYVNLLVVLVDVFTQLGEDIMWASNIYKKSLLEVNVCSNHLFFRINSWIMRRER